MKILSERQNELIHVSLKLIADKGIQNLTVKKLAQTVGISEPAIYRHFKSKSHLLLSILNNFEASVDNLITLVNNSNVSYVDKLEIFFTKRCEEFQANPEISTALFSEEIFKSDEELSVMVKKLMTKNQQFVSSLITQAKANKEIHAEIPTEHLTLIVISSLRLLVTRWRMGNFNFNLENEGKQVFCSLKRLIAKEY